MEKLEKTIQNLGKLFIGTDKIFVSLLPTSATTVLVKYSPEILVSCIIPPKDFEIKYSSTKNFVKKRDLLIGTPTLIMSCGYSDTPSVNNYDSINTGYTLWVLDTSRDSGVFVKPYKLANIYEEGTICFGDLIPTNLRQAFNYYWTSGFNDDIKLPHSCLNRVHKYEWHSGCYCDGLKKSHICSCSRKTFHSHIGCGCTTIGESKRCKGQCKKIKCVCCKAIAKLQKKKLKKKKLSDKQLLKVASLKLDIGEVYPGCKCYWRHKRDCPCARNKCNCPCSCNCCNKLCKHDFCECSCCKNKCGCKCKCSKLEKIKQHLTTYHQRLLPKQRWKNLTAFFCGEKYWAAQEEAEAVLVCSTRKLLEAIPKKFWRRDRDGRPLIIALGNRRGLRGWEFRSGSYRFYLDHRSVVFK